MGKKWAQMPLLTSFFSWVGLASGWRVRRFHTNTCVPTQQNLVYRNTVMVGVRVTAVVPMVAMQGVQWLYGTLYAYSCWAFSHAIIALVDIL